MISQNKVLTIRKKMMMKKKITMMMISKMTMEKILRKKLKKNQKKKLKLLLKKLKWKNKIPPNINLLNLLQESKQDIYLVLNQKLMLEREIKLSISPSVSLFFQEVTPDKVWNRKILEIEEMWWVDLLKEINFPPTQVLSPISI